LAPFDFSFYGSLLETLLLGFVGKFPGRILNHFQDAHYALSSLIPFGQIASLSNNPLSGLLHKEGTLSKGGIVCQTIQVGLTLNWLPWVKIKSIFLFII
jgi:hypothetical protein